MNWTEKHIKGLLFQKKIRGFQAPKKKAADKRLPEKKSTALVWLEWNLQFLANELSLSMEKEFQFNHERKFRFDFCFPGAKVAVEYNGIMSDKSRHTTIGGYSMDQEKVNLAQKDGWVVLSYTPLNYKSSVQDVKQTINKKLNG